MLAAAPLFAASPMVGPEVPASAPSPVPAERVSSFAVAVASNGSMAMAVWVEQRAASYEIFAARFDAAGNVLDPYSIQVTTGSGVETASPRVVWNGAEFVVVWTALDPKTIRPAGWMCTVGEDGRPGAPSIFGPGIVEDVAAAFGIVAVALRGVVSPNEGAIDIHLLEGNRKIAQLALAKNSSGTRLTATASGFAAAWWASAGGGMAEMRAARFSPWGAFEQRDVVISESRSFEVRLFDIAARGDDVFIALGGQQQVTLLKMARLRDPSLVATLPKGGHVVDLLWDGGGLAAVVNVGVESTLWRLSESGALLASKPLAAWTAAALTRAGGRTFAVIATSPFDGAMVRVFAESFDAPRVLLSRSAARQSTPVIASDGERLLVAWNESTRVMGVIATREGRPLGAPFEIFAARESAGGLAAIFAAGEYVVMRQEPGELLQLQYVVATHVSRDGVPRRDRVILTNTAEILGGISLATDGTNVLVLWSGGATQPPHGRCRLLTPAGPRDETVELLNNGSVAAWNGSLYVIAMPGTVSIARMSREGTVLSRDSLDDVYGNSVSIASDGDGFLVTYVRIGLRQGDLMAFPLDRDGRPAGGHVLLEPAGNFAPALFDGTVMSAWNGRTYELAWTGVGSGSGTFDQRLSRDARTSSRTALGGIATPAVFGLGNGDSIVAYTRPVAELGGSQRVFTRVLSQPRTRPVHH